MSKINECDRANKAYWDAVAEVREMKADRDKMERTLQSVIVRYTQLKKQADSISQKLTQINASLPKAEERAERLRVEVSTLAPEARREAEIQRLKERIAKLEREVKKM